MNEQNEQKEQKEFVKWFNRAYPLFMLQAINISNKFRATGSIKGFPDLFICQRTERFGGFFIEFKKTGAKVFKKNGKLKKDKHLERQYEVINRLRKNGYKAEFAVGINEAKRKTRDYMGNAIEFHNKRIVDECVKTTTSPPDATHNGN